MNDKEMKLFRIRKDAKDLFVKKAVDLRAPHVIASIAAAAAGMSMVSGVTSVEDTLRSVIASFTTEKRDEIYEMATSMNPSIVNGNIGFATDYMDYGAAVSGYNSQKANYDNFYNEINYAKDLVKSDEAVL